MAFVVALTLEPIKISTVWLIFLHDGLAQSPSEAVPLDWPLDLWEGPGVQLLVDGQSVALWEDDV